MDIDPQVLATQDEWSDELKSIPLPNIFFLENAEDISKNLSNPYELAGIWLLDSFHAQRIDYPQSDHEFYMHKLARSNWFHILFDLCAAVQILVALILEGHECDHSLSGNSEIVFITVNLFCTLVFILDLGLHYGVNSSSKSISRRPWSLTRLVCCLMSLVDIMAYLVNRNYYQFRVVRSVYPLIFITRRSNVKKMMQLSFEVAYKSIPVLVAILSILCMWGYFGFLIFRGIEVETPKFDSPWGGLYTCLHCFTSRAYTLIAMQPYWAHFQASGIFFASLTVSTDLIGISLITGIGIRQYRLFSAQIMQVGLTRRKAAIVSIFHAFAHQDTFSVECWIKLCTSLQSEYRMTVDQAKAVFFHEDRAHCGSVNLSSFIRLCAFISCKVRYGSEENRLSMPFRLTMMSGTGISSDNQLSLALDRKSALPYSARLELICWVIATSYVRINIPWWGSTDFYLHQGFIGIIHIILLVQLSYLSSGSASPGWFLLGQILEIFFLADMIVQLGAYGWERYTELNVHKANIAVNLASLVALLCLGDGSSSLGQSSFIPTICIQSLRFIPMFFIVNDIAIFELMFPVLLRAVCLYFSVLYFFAIFAHTFFCSSLSGVTIVQGFDDDANNWNKYPLLLNFSSYWQSLFTLFQMSILANWSMVMDAAEKESGYVTYFFFYFFRLFVILYSIPTFVGFIVQSYLGASQTVAASRAAAASVTANTAPRADQDDNRSAESPLAITSNRTGEREFDVDVGRESKFDLMMVPREDRISYRMSATRQSITSNIDLWKGGGASRLSQSLGQDKGRSISREQRVESRDNLTRGLLLAVSGHQGATADVVPTSIDTPLSLFSLSSSPSGSVTTSIATSFTEKSKAEESLVVDCSNSRDGKSEHDDDDDDDGSTLSGVGGDRDSWGVAAHRILPVQKAPSSASSSPSLHRSLLMNNSPDRVLPLLAETVTGVGVVGTALRLPSLPPSSDDDRMAQLQAENEQLRLQLATALQQAEDNARDVARLEELVRSN